MGNVVRSGEVDVKRPFSVEHFDDDDGFVVTHIDPGVYEYRVLDVNGWKPRQLKVAGEWVDVMDMCRDLEDLLAVNEAVTITKKADVKNLPHGTLVHISGTGTSDDGDYVVDQESTAAGLVSKKDPKRKLYFNARFDRRIQDMLRQGVRFDVTPAVDETTGVGNIAGTVDYLGHGPIKPLNIPGTEPVYPDENEKEKQDKDKDHSDDDAWVSPIGRIFAGESVRTVIGELVN